MRGDLPEDAPCLTAHNPVYLALNSNQAPTICINTLQLEHFHCRTFAATSPPASVLAHNAKLCLASLEQSSNQKNIGIAFICKLRGAMVFYATMHYKHSRRGNFLHWAILWMQCGNSNNCTYKEPE
eukprot:639638-Pelagomonas_calceolata.AAC.2